MQNGCSGHRVGYIKGRKIRMSKRAIEKVELDGTKIEVCTLEDVVGDMHATVHAVVVWVSKVKNVDDSMQRSVMGAV